MPKQCSNPTCSNPVFSKGLCINHWRSSEHNKGLQQKKVPIKPANKPIPKISDKQKKLNAAYSALRKVYLEQHPYCMAQWEGCTHNSTDLHHKKSRGKHLLDSTTFMSLCRNCHDKIHNQHARALSAGFIESKLEK